ncbi:MAG TPA: elongation factor G [candidate division Zixibacteria bacterium]|nr:elongation factor G [candidate division Zixibacteria bacterium]
MKPTSPDRIRNVALISHGGAGKTSLAEAMLFDAGAIQRMGSVDAGTATLDWDPDEQKRQQTINLAIASLEHQGTRVTIVDTPGYADYQADVIEALAAVDAAIVVVDASAGVEVGTQEVWRLAEERKLPRFVFINKMDRENANYDAVLDQLKAAFGPKIAPVYLPIGSADSFRGYIDVIEEHANVYEDGRPREVPIPDELQGAEHSRRDALVEAAAEASDELMMKYLEGEEISDDEIGAALHKGTREGSVVPVFVGSALKNIGVRELIEMIVKHIPSPAEVGSRTTSDGRELAPDPNGPFVAHVFKTIADPFVGRLTYFRVISGTLSSQGHVYNVNRREEERIGNLLAIQGKEQSNLPQVGPGDIAAVAKLTSTQIGDTLVADRGSAVELPPLSFPEPTLQVAVEPESKADLDKLGQALNRLQEEEPCVRVHREEATGETILTAMGDAHVDVIVERLKRKFGASVKTRTPQVPYRESIRKPAKVDNKFKRQTGGHGQYGHVVIEFEPLGPDRDFEFGDRIVGGVVPKQYIPAVEKGLREAMAEGVLAGFPVVGLKATLVDGSYHTVDSSEMAFKIAASQALKKAFPEADPTLLEPILEVEVVVPDEYMGDVMGQITAKRGHVLGMDSSNGMQRLRAQVPQAEMYQYATELRSITQGRGRFSWRLDHYAEVPHNLAEKVIAERARANAGDRH